MNWFGSKRTIEMGLKSLWMHKLRSTLTALGIVFGVCSVIAMLAIGEGASQEAQESIARLGSTNLIIETIKPPEKDADSSQSEGIQNYGLTYKDAESIRNTIPDVEVAVPVREVDQRARYRSREFPIKIIGTVPWYPEISPIRLLRGRFLTSADLQYRLRVCVIEDELDRKLFTIEDSIGKDVRILGNYYKVVGIVSQSSAGSAQTNSSKSLAGMGSGVIGNIYIPVTTTKDRFIEFTGSFSGESRDYARVELQKIIVKVDSSDKVLMIRNIIDSLLARIHEKQDYHIVVPLELLQQAVRTRRIFSIVLGSIAAISLLVGGIGIMNIMLASVSERTREIGIRRALGAKKIDIIVQFLTETVLLTLIGGILGIVLGALIPFLVTYFGHMPTVITFSSLALSFGISGAIGVTFGLYPAYRAANMDPIESLRHE